MAKTMGKEGGVSKMDPNTEAFQMRAQWKKTDACKKMWYSRWSWLLDAQKEASKEADAVKAAAADVVYRRPQKEEDTRTLKPVPQTSTGVIGWVASKPEFKLEIYTNWMQKIPIKAPNAWETIEYWQEKDNENK